MRGSDRGRFGPDGAVVFVAMELSKSAWLLASQGSPSGKGSSHRLESGDIEGLLALLRRLQRRERQACGGGDVLVVLGHEAGASPRRRGGSPAA
jgi:transposase